MLRENAGMWGGGVVVVVSVGLVEGYACVDVDCVTMRCVERVRRAVPALRVR